MFLGLLNLFSSTLPNDDILTGQVMLLRAPALAILSAVNKPWSCTWAPGTPSRWPISARLSFRKAQRWIKALPRKGFRFVGDVREEHDIKHSRVGDISPDTGNTSPESERASVAVLPFRNLGGTSELGHSIDGIVGDLTADLSRFPLLRVVGNGVTAVRHQEPTDLRQMARELGVQYTIDGSVEETGARLRMTVQLTEANRGTQLWAQRFDMDLGDFPAARDEIRMIIVGSLTGERGPLTQGRAPAGDAEISGRTDGARLEWTPKVRQ